MMPRKALTESLIQILRKTLQKPSANVSQSVSKKVAFDRNLQLQFHQIHLMQGTKGFVQKSVSTVRLLDYGAATPLAHSSRGKFLPHIVNRSSWSLSGNSSDLMFCRNQGLLSVGTVHYQQSATYRTAPSHRTRADDKDTTNQSDRIRLKDEKENADLSSEQENKDSAQASSGSIFQRFKQAYKEHGKILIGVHIVTSTVWFGSFFYAVSVGIDVVPWLEHIGVSETLIKPFRSPNVGNIAMAYLMYKLATPARYTVTLGGTNLMIRFMRNTGRMEPMAEGHSIRELYKEGKSQMQHRTRDSTRHVKHHKRSK